MLGTALAIPTLHIDNLAGSDDANGTFLHPVRSIAQANRMVNGPTAFRFARGQRFHGTLRLNYAGSSVTSYGPDHLPSAEITSTSPIAPSAWMPGPEPNTWLANLSVPSSFASDQLQGELVLLCDGEAQQVARTPNLGSWARVVDYDETSGTVTYTGVDGLPTDLSGAGFRLRQSSYQYASGWAASADPVHNTIHLILPTALTPTPGFGFFLDNMTAFADQPGEFTVRVAGASSDTPGEVQAVVQLFWSNGSAPSEHSFELATGLHAISHGSIGQPLDANPTPCDDVAISDVAVSGAMADCIFLQGCTGATIHNVSVSSCGHTAIFANSTGVSITSTSGKNAFGGGLRADNGSSIVESTLELIGNRAGYGYIGGGYLAVSCATYCTVLGSKLQSIGYVGIRFGPHSLISRNHIQDVMQLLNDGGAIYTWNNNPPYPVHNITITQNFINGSKANLDSVPPGTQQHWGRGIYMDDRVNNVTIAGNTVTGASSEGIFLHGGFDYSVHDNVVFDVGMAGIGLQDEVDEPIRRASVLRNTLVTFGSGSLDGSGAVCLQQTSGSNLTTFAWGDISGNTYVSPWATTGHVRRRIVEFRGPYYGASRQMGAASWQVAGNGDREAIGYPAQSRQQFLVRANLSGNVLPFGGLNSSYAVSQWRPMAPIAGGHSHLVLDIAPPAAMGPEPAALFSTSYGYINLLLRSPEFGLELGHARIQATLWAEPRFVPNPETIGIGVGICVAPEEGRGSLGRGDESGSTWCAGTMVGTQVEVYTGPYGAASPAPPTRLDFVVSIPGGSGTLDILVPDYSTKLWLRDVSVTFVTVEPAPVLERLVVNPTPATANVPIPGPVGAEYTDLNGSGYFADSIQLLPFSSTVLLCKSGC